MFARYVGQLRGAPCYILRNRWRSVFRAHAFVVGKRIVFHSETDFNNVKVRNHELEHMRQRRLIGPLFPLVYLVCDLTVGYERNPFEVRAREAEQS